MIDHIFENPEAFAHEYRATLEALVGKDFRDCSAQDQYQALAQLIGRKANREFATSDSENKKSDKKNADAKKDDTVKPIVVELDKIHDRIVRVTPNSSNLAGAAITKDGNTLYYLSSVEKGYDLWKMDLRKHSTSLLNKMDSRWADIVTDKEGNPSRNWTFDCSAATENLLLQAEAMGLGAVWTGVYPYDERIEAVKQALHLPDHLIPLNVIPIGYPKGDPQPKDKYDPAKVEYRN